MKKRLFLILSAGFLLIAGCGRKSSDIPDTETMLTETEHTETVKEATETDMASDTEKPAEEQTEKEIPKETEAEDTQSDTTSKNQSVSQPGQKTGTTPAQSSADVPQQEETVPQETAPQEQAAAVSSYNPVSVCSQAIAKCQAGGMITTTDNLANLLSEGKITQEEYNSYYPYDGLGYYSVFVETDLNQASTVSGRKLGSEGEIADYIADMMLLETEPVFYIEYAGVYSLNGTDFYEFRCYR